MDVALYLLSKAENFLLNELKGSIKQKVITLNYRNLWVSAC